MGRIVRLIVYLIFVGALFAYAMLSAFSATYLLDDMVIPDSLKFSIQFSLGFLICSLIVLMVQYGILILRSRDGRGSVATALQILFLIMGSGIAVTWYFFNEKRLFAESSVPMDK